MIDNQNYTLELKYDFTDSEIAVIAKELANANTQCGSIEQRKREIDTQLKADIEAQKSIVARLSGLIGKGFEYRQIKCRVELDTPELGKKRVVRLDTGEEVSVKPMTDTDRQMVLDLQSKAEGAEELDRVSKEMGEDRPKGPIVTPPPFVPQIGNGPGMVRGSVVVDSVEGITHVGPTLAPARAVGGTHQKGTRGKPGRNLDAEAFADGSAVEFDGVPDEFTPEESPE